MTTNTCNTTHYMFPLRTESTFTDGFRHATPAARHSHDAVHYPRHFLLCRGNGDSGVTAMQFGIIRGKSLGFVTLEIRCVNVVMLVSRLSF